MNLPTLWLKFLFVLLVAVICPPIVFGVLAAVLEAGKLCAKEVKAVLCGPTWKDRSMAFYRLLILVVVVPFILLTVAMVLRGAAAIVGSKG